MRDLMSNNRDLWYAVYTGQTNVVDEKGDMTGEQRPAYDPPVHFKANLSATRGTQGFTGTGSSYDYFGADIKYDLIISTANMKLPIDEYSLIWDKEPERDLNNRVLYDKAGYRVKAVARGIHHMKYAIQTLQHDAR